MTKAERDQLIRLVHQRAKLAKAEAVQRQKVLLAEIQDLIAAEHQTQDELLAGAVDIAREAARKANGLIVARCADLGIPAEYAPRLELGWRPRSAQFADPQRRAELRKLAEQRLEAATATAKIEIDRQAVETETQLIATGLESAEAAAFLAAMPTVEELMPQLSLDSLGVERWQPPDDAAARLVTPSTPAERKRLQVLRAIAANPDASDRRIAEIARCDHKTVAKYRHERGELSAASGESPTEDSAR